MIRPASPADAEFLADLAAATPGAPRWTRAQYSGILTAARANHVVWVAETGGKIKGFAALSVHAPDAELESIAVHPAHQRHGLGAALLSAALQHVRNVGVTRVYLEVRASSSAQVLYRKLGFARTGLRPRYYSNPSEDAILMQWGAAEDHPTGEPLSGIIKGDYGS